MKLLKKEIKIGVKLIRINAIHPIHKRKIGAIYIIRDIHHGLSNLGLVREKGSYKEVGTYSKAYLKKYFVLSTKATRILFSEV